MLRQSAPRGLEMIVINLVITGLDVDEQDLTLVSFLHLRAYLPLIPLFSALSDLFFRVAWMCHDHPPLQLDPGCIIARRRSLPSSLLCRPMDRRSIHGVTSTLVAPLSPFFSAA